MAASERDTERFLSAHEFAAMPEPEDGYRYELVRGRLVREPLPAPVHGRIEALLVARLHEFVERSGAGVVLSNTGFLLERDPDTVRGPDVAYVRSDRVPASGYGTEFWQLGPDLAIEVRSPSNRNGAMIEKVTAYLAAGSRLVWVVDPRRRTVTIHSPEREARILNSGSALDGEDVLPGFRMPLSELFS